MSDGPTMPQDRGDRARIFTLEEANACLPWVREQFDRINAARQGIERAREALAQLTPRMRSNGHRNEALTLERDLEGLMEGLSDAVHAFDDAGIQLKDIDNGIIDFPAIHRGRVVLLCWRLGEGNIAFWHEMTTGFAGRRPISEFGR